MTRSIDKVLSQEDFIKLCSSYKLKKAKIVFTNGCFDIVHLGHLRYLEEAKLYGDVLVVAVNSDNSVRSIKGSSRPIVPEKARAELVAGFHCVDWVTIFDTPDPLPLIEKVKPDVLVKGADWDMDKIVGRDFVESYGGKVIRIPLVSGYSTTHIIAKIRALDNA